MPYERPKRAALTGCFSLRNPAGYGWTMTRATWRGLMLLVLLGAVGTSASAARPAASKRPNFVFFLVDDLGWRDTGCYGSTFYETPHVDRLAAEGMRFTDAYAACPVCSPTRASIMAGKYPARMGTTDWFGAPQPATVGRHWTRNKPLLPAPYVDHLPLAEVTLAEALKAAGYTTFFAGKWHLGGKGFWPENQGFDVNKGGFRAGSPPGGYFAPYRNPKLPDGPPGEHLPARLADEAVRFLDQTDARPFLLYLSFYSVHTPLQARPDLRRKYEKKAKQVVHQGPRWIQEGRRKARQVQDHPIYAAMVEAVDQAVGHVLNAVRRLGLADRTVVVFMSDNGGLSTSEGSPTSNLPLRAGKGWLYEGGIREPMIVKWPGVVKPATVCHQPVISTDFYPTMLQIAGLPPRRRQHVDGVSLVPLLRQQGVPPRKTLYWHYPHYGNQGGSPAGAIRAGDWKLIEWFEDHRVELFNLREDIGERHNLARRYPARARQLLGELKAWRSAVGAKMPAPNPAAAMKDATRPIPARVADLMDRMTLEEKVDLLGGDGFVTKVNRRLGIPALIMTDGPLGPNGKGRATNYSSMINLAATFDVDLMRAVARNIGAETRALGYNMLLAPMVNIARVPQGGRTFECFGEDPFLASRMTVAYVNGVQANRVVTCTKALVANNQEWNRFDVDVRLDERALREIYLPAFKAAVQEADTWTIMAAYNQVRGDYCCENRYLLTDILKHEWGFPGVVVSDWGGARSTVKMAQSGMDLEMPAGRYYGAKLLKAVRDGRVKESVINDKVRRILGVMFRAGLFDESATSYGGPTDTPARRTLARRAARASIVLLKNKEHVLPLDKAALKNVAVIGPNGNTARMCGGGSGALTGHYGISVLQGIRDRLGSGATVRFQRGVVEKRRELPVAKPACFVLPNGKPGIKAAYFNNRSLRGAPVLTRIEKSINFDWGYGAVRPEGGPGSPAPGIIQIDKWSARWTGQLIAPGDGWYDIGVKADNGVRLFLDGKKVVDAWTDAKPGEFKIARYKFTAGQHYDLRVEFYENWGSCRCILGMAPRQTGTWLQDAVALARQADAVILCLGLDRTMEGEAADRQQLELPEDQRRLIRAVMRANGRTVIVLNNATPIIMREWIDKVPAVVEAFYPGQEGGRAVAEVLLGEVNPAGRLPITFPERWRDSPAFGSYPGEKTVAYYREGIFVGYRHFDKNGIEPLFPFGYGLSYTTFEYRDLTIVPATIGPGQSATVKVRVRNSGRRAGDEVVQLYVGDVKASVPREVRALKGFTRVHLQPGASKTVVFKLSKKHLAFYSARRKQWVAEPGVFEVAIGGSSRDIRMTGKLVLQ